jgi:thioredoxin 1
MKEILIAFIFALIIGSIINGYKGDTSTTPTAPNPAAVQSQNIQSQNVIPLDEHNFRSEVLESKLPVLVDFDSPASVQCQHMAPILAQLADEEKGNLKVVKIDVMSNPDIANKYGITVLPGLQIFKGGERVESLTGEVPHDALVSLVDKYEDKKPATSSSGGA